MLVLNDQLYDILKPSVLIIIIFITWLTLIYCKRNVSQKLPPGSLGLPVIGETLSFMKALKADKLSEWIKNRASVNGVIFKTSVIGSNTIVITGRAGNKFILSATDEILSVKQPQSIVRISGKHNIFELTGERYKIVKGAVMVFLKPESLQEYVGKMDALVKTQLLKETKKDTIMAVPLIKKVTFNLTCTLLFKLYDNETKETLFEDFTQVLKGLWAFPFNIYGTTYYKALQARARIEKRVQSIMKSRKMELLDEKINGKDDLLTSLITLKDENNELLRDEEIVDNFVTLMIASHDTTAILLSLLVWKLAKDTHTYNKVLEEQEQILRERQDPKQETLTWIEVQKMKYTWRVAQELMRQIPPVFGNFRKAMKDITFGGYDIPEGWQVFWEATGTHMDSDIFEDPKGFDPSRFENPLRPVPPFAYIPFGSGPRMCIGNEFARVEVLVVIHRLVTDFEWTLIHPDEKITREPFPYPCKGLPIKLISRTR